MRHLITTVIFAFTAICASATAQTSDAAGKAQEAAQHWLSLADSGQYAATWEQAAEPFQNAIKKTEWEQALLAVRTPVGVMEKRALSSMSFTNSLPGAPDGQYVVIRFTSQFSNKKSAVETITPMLGKDGTWRVSGYFIN